MPPETELARIRLAIGSACGSIHLGIGALLMALEGPMTSASGGLGLLLALVGVAQKILYWSADRDLQRAGRKRTPS